MPEPAARPGSLGIQGIQGSPGSGPPLIQCVGAVITDECGRMLLILRGHEPGQGLWSVPGGKIEPGETDQEAVAREVREETGLDVTCGRLLGSAEVPGQQDGAEMVVRDYLAAVVPGSAVAPVAADDAADVRWVTDAEADAMDARGEITPGLLPALRSWL